MTQAIGGRNFTAQILVLDEEGAMIDTVDISDEIISLTVSTPAIDTRKPNSRISWSGRMTLGLTTTLAYSLDSRSTTGSPSGAEIWARGNQLVLSVANTTNTLGAFPTRFYIREIPQPPNPPENTITVEIVDGLEAENYPQPEGDLAGFNEGASTDRKAIINNVLATRDLPAVASSDTCLVYPLKRPPQKTDTEASIDFCAGLAATAGYTLWQDGTGATRLTPINFDQASPKFTIDVDSDAVEFNFVNQDERPPETLVVNGAGYETATNTFPRITETFIYTTRGALLGNSDPYAGNQCVGEYLKVTESFNGDAFVVETEKQVPRILIDPNVATTRTALKRAELITETKRYRNDTLAIVEAETDEDWARGWINKNVGSQEFSTFLFNSQNYKNSTKRFFYDSLTDQLERTEFKLEADPSYLGAGLTTVPEFTAQTEKETWLRKAREHWNYTKLVQKSAQELYQGDIGNLSPYALVSDPASSRSIQTNSGEAQPPQTERKPSETESKLRQYTGEAQFKPIAGRNPKQKKLDTINVSGPFCVSDAQCSFLAKLLGRFRQGRALAATLTCAVPDWFLASYEPLPRVDVTLNGITTAYLADAIAISLTADETVMSCYLIEIGTVGVTPAAITPRFQTIQPVQTVIDLSSLVSEQLNLITDEVQTVIELDSFASTLTPSVQTIIEISSIAEAEETEVAINGRLICTAGAPGGRTDLGKAIEFDAPGTFTLQLEPGFDISIVTGATAIQLHRWSQEPNTGLTGRAFVGETSQAGGSISVTIDSTHRWVSVFARNPANSNRFDGVYLSWDGGDRITLVSF